MLIERVRKTRRLEVCGSEIECIVPSANLCVWRGGAVLLMGYRTFVRINLGMIPRPDVSIIYLFCVVLQEYWLGARPFWDSQASSSCPGLLNSTGIIGKATAWFPFCSTAPFILRIGTGVCPGDESLLNIFRIRPH